MHFLMHSLIRARSNIHIVLCQSFCRVAYGWYLPILIPLYFYSVAWKKRLKCKFRVSS